MHERGSVIPEHSNVGPGSGVATEQDSLTEESKQTAWSERTKALSPSEIAPDATA